TERKAHPPMPPVASSTAPNRYGEIAVTRNPSPDCTASLAPSVSAVADSATAVEMLEESAVTSRPYKRARVNTTGIPKACDHPMTAQHKAEAGRNTVII